MNIRLTMLTAACALALAGCADKSAPTAEPEAAPPATETAPAPAEAPAAATPEVAADVKAAVVADCSTEIQGNDAMQFNVNSITVPASCTDFTIKLTHSGTMPVAAMGHNVVITTQADMATVAADGIPAGVASDYIKAGDTRVIAHTKLIGGGENASVTFPVAKIKDGGPYEFFCSFPGHSAVMKGTIAVL